MDCELCTVHYGLRTMDCKLWTVHCGLCTADYGLCYLRRKGAWDAYLESVQYGLDYILGRCKCLSASEQKRVCIITPHLTLDVTDIS